jgi:hypothetical protein
MLGIMLSLIVIGNEISVTLIARNAPQMFAAAGAYARN